MIGQYDAQAYRKELASIGELQSDGTGARKRVFELLAGTGVSPAEADELVAQLEAGAVARAHTWISESSAPHGTERSFEDGWSEGVRAIGSDLLRLAETTAAQRGRALSRAQLLAGLLLDHVGPPLPHTPATPVADPVPPLDAGEVLAAAQRCTWACTDPGNWFLPEASDEILTVALGTVREDERDGYAQRLEAFAERHRERLEELLRAYGPGSTPAEHGRYALVGQPESLVICERLESAQLLLLKMWDNGLDEILLEDLAFAWGTRRRL